MAEKQRQEKRLKTLEKQDEGSGVSIPNPNPRHIPSEIIYNIVSRLPLEEILRCSTVSTYWYNSIKNLHCSKSETLDILISYRDKQSGVGDSLHMISSQQRGKHKEFRIRNKLKSKNIIGSCNGLLCFARQRTPTPYAIYNPITKDTTMLPKLYLHFPYSDGLYVFSYGFGFDSKSKKYKVVVAYEVRSYIGNVRGYIITVGETSWRSLLFPNELRIDIRIDQPAVPFFNGAFHWVLGKHISSIYSEKYQLDGILTLDINTEKFNITQFSSSMYLDASVLRVLNIENSLAVVGDKRLNKPCKTLIWKLLGVNADGSCDYQRMSLSVASKCMRLFSTRWPCPLLLGALGDNTFLFMVETMMNFNNLFIYDAKNDEGSIVELPSEVPVYKVERGKVLSIKWNAILFQPSLVSLAL